MGPELLLLILAGAGLGGIGGSWWIRRAQGAFVAHVQTEWVRAGRIIRRGPVGAISFGARPQGTYTGGVFGALGITDRAVIFDGRRSDRRNVAIPLTAIRWVGLTTIPVWAGRVAVHKRALAIHFEGPDGWRVGTFVADILDDLAQWVSQETGLPVHDAGAERADFGPARAARLVQDVYGDWSMDREGDLYLAPDRLLFAWRSAISLDDIQRLDVISAGGLEALNPLSADVLRVEYRTADGEIDAAGFRVRRAARWADAIARRSARRLPVTQGRKKKPG